jgi:putative copper resistance protein D
MYFGIAGALGGQGSLLLLVKVSQRGADYAALVGLKVLVCQYSLGLIVLGTAADAADFLVQTGNMAGRGLTGVFDAQMIDLMWKSSVGTVVFTRCVTFFFAGVFVGYQLYVLSKKRDPIGLRMPWIAVILMSLGFGYSYTLLGHTTEIRYGHSLLISLHVLIGLGWIGSLWPLRRACAVLSHQTLHTLMVHFGRCAVWLVAVLIACGVLMLWQILSSFEQLFTDDYGLIFLIKITLVLIMLALAAWHKLKLVPRLLLQVDGRKALSHSIGFEMLIGLFVLLSSAIVTTVVGPMSSSH